MCIASGQYQKADNNMRHANYQNALLITKNLHLFSLNIFTKGRSNL